MGNLDAGRGSAANLLEESELDATAPERARQNRQPTVDEADAPPANGRAASGLAHVNRS
jgi:hypothetical protein